MIRITLALIFATKVFIICRATSVVPQCPARCSCNGIFAMFCSGLTEKAVVDIFSSPLFLEVFANSLQNLTIVESDFRQFSVLPRMDNLLYLDLSANQLESLNAPRDFSYASVAVLNLNGNKFNSITRNSFLLFPNVEEVRVQRNRLFSVDWEAFRLFKLKRLFLSHNYLPTISEHMLRFTPALELLDLSFNQLTAAQSSSFFTAQRLTSINLSHNRIQRFDYDSFSPLYQLESIDLSFNNLSVIPADIRQFVGLRVLNFSGNPIEKISAGDIVHPLLQELDISFCSKVRLVESQAFAKVPNLQLMKMSHNPSLVFFSPSAFVNNSQLFEVHLVNNSLESIDEQTLQAPTRIFLANNPLRCGCVAEVVKKLKAHIGDLKTAQCRSALNELMTLEALEAKAMGTLLAERESCQSEPLLPFGTSLTANVGDFFSMYCSSKVNTNALSWTFPNGTEVMANQVELPIQSPLADGLSFFASSFYAPHDPASGPPQPGGFGDTFTPTSSERARVLATKERMRFDVVLIEDAGEYMCSVRQNGHSNHRRVHLHVHRPNIGIYTLDVGTHYVALAWNDSLNIRASDRVRLYLNVKDSLGSTSRSIQLSLHNPWYSYNVMRLKPSQNYTFCLVYLMNENNSEHLVYETCLQVETLPNLSFWNSLSLSTVITFFVILFLLFALLCARGMFIRFHVWQQAKRRARMNESISGQSFLSRSSNMKGNALTHSITYENTSQLMSQSNSTTLNRLSLSSADERQPSNGRHLLVEDAAV